LPFREGPDEKARHIWLRARGLVVISRGQGH
jgi:hypothetical protein